MLWQLLNFTAQHSSHNFFSMQFSWISSKSRDRNAETTRGKKIKFINTENILQSIMRQAVPCSQWIIKQVSVHEKHHTGAAGYALKEDVTMWEARTGGGSWQDLQAHGERDPHWSWFTGRTCDPRGDPCCNSWRTASHRRDPLWSSS